MMENRPYDAHRNLDKTVPYAVPVGAAKARRRAAGDGSDADAARQGHLGARTARHPAGGAARMVIKSLQP